MRSPLISFSLWLLMLPILLNCGKSQSLSLHKPGGEAVEINDNGFTNSTQTDYVQKAKPTPSVTPPSGDIPVPSPVPSPTPPPPAAPLSCSVSLSSAEVMVGTPVTATLIYAPGATKYSITAQGAVFPGSTYSFTPTSVGSIPVNGNVSNDTTSATCVANLVVRDAQTQSALVNCGNSGVAVSSDSCVVPGATKIISVLVNRPRSVKPCVLGQTYSFNGDTLTTSNDCVATFQVLFK